MTIDDRYRRLLARRVPDEERIFGKSAEAFEQTEGTTTKYLIGAMSPLEARYTERLLEQGNRVENQLSKRLYASYPGVEFRRQGSVSNGTHIRHYSDVDVLVMIDKFVTLEHPQVPSYPYQGVPTDDLEVLRSACSRELQAAFPAVQVDDSGSTAVKLMKSGSLACDVDVVPANWYDTLDYARFRLERDRGVQVLDRDRMERIKNAPFLFNDRLHQRDVEAYGVVRQIVRLLKTVKADLEEDESTSVQFSSFDICSVVYRFHVPSIHGLAAPLDLVSAALGWMFVVAQNPSTRAGVKVVDDSREIFDKSEKVVAFGKLVADLARLRADALREQQRRLMVGNYLQ